MTVALVADVGGTNARFGLVEASGPLTAGRSYINAEFDSFDAMLSEYLASTGAAPAAAAIAVAGPVSANAVTMTNLGWRIAGNELRSAHGLDRVEIINDFAAQAWATLALGSNDLHVLASGAADADGNRAILGPGTGLGVSGLIQDESGWNVVSGEGGHVSLTGATDKEQALVAWAVRRFGHCSAERLLSGPGLALIYEFLGGGVVEPAEVTAAARRSDSRAAHAVDMFLGMLGSVAGDLALTLGARGGVFLAGGILPANLDLVDGSLFMSRFLAKGRLRDYLAAIPVKVVIAPPHPGLLGLTALLQRRS